MSAKTMAREVLKVAEAEGGVRNSEEEEEEKSKLLS
jgi:phosphoserine aminotransferase